MLVRIIECLQNSPEWFEARRGIPTASEFQCLLAKSTERKGRKTYLYDLAGEILSGVVAPSYSNGHMERGKEWEDEARNWYAFATDADLKPVGFVRNDEFRAGCSPDCLIGEDGGLEIKTRLPRLQLELLESGELPSENKAQVQGCLWITGREWWDYVSYSKGIKPFKIRVYRDEPYIERLQAEVASFNAELRALVERHS